MSRDIRPGAKFTFFPKICPDCGAELAIRYARNTGNPFWGCTSYPKCKHAENIGHQQMMIVGPMLVDYLSEWWATVISPDYNRGEAESLDELRSSMSEAVDFVTTYLGKDILKGTNNE